MYSRSGSGVKTRFGILFGDDSRRYLSPPESLANRAHIRSPPWSTIGEGDKIAPYNPLRRVPALVLDGGEALVKGWRSSILSMCWSGRKRWASPSVGRSAVMKADPAQ
jgi:hypothetical protein